MEIFTSVICRTLVAAHVDADASKAVWRRLRLCSRRVLQYTIYGQFEFLDYRSDERKIRTLRKRSIFGDGYDAAALKAGWQRRLPLSFGEVLQHSIL